MKSSQTIAEERYKVVQETNIVLASAKDAALSRHILADDIATLSEDLVSTRDHGTGRSTLLEDLEGLHRKLNELEHVRDYVKVVERGLFLRYALFTLSYAQTLRSNREAVLLQISELEKSENISQGSFNGYIALQQLVKSVSDACGISTDPTIETSSIHLVNFLEKLCDQTWQDIKAKFSQ